MKHTAEHELAGKTVTLAPKAPDAEIRDGVPFTVEDWADRVLGTSWGTANGNPTAIKYGLRIGFGAAYDLANDDVVYGKVGNYGHIVHVSELGSVVS